MFSSAGLLNGGVCGVFAIRDQSFGGALLKSEEVMGLIPKDGNIYSVWLFFEGLSLDWRQVC